VSHRRSRLKDVPAVPDPPEIVRDEAILVPAGETAYWLLLDDPTVELLRQGIVTEELAARAHRSLSWKREMYRNEAREQVS
jgi:hypothetical protein